MNNGDRRARHDAVALYPASDAFEPGVGTFIRLPGTADVLGFALNSDRLRGIIASGCSAAWHSPHRVVMQRVPRPPTQCVFALVAALLEVAARYRINNPWQVEYVEQKD